MLKATMEELIPDMILKFSEVIDSKINEYKVKFETEYTAKIEELTNSVTELQASVETKDAELQAKAEEITAKETEVSELKAQMENMVPQRQSKVEFTDVITKFNDITKQNQNKQEGTVVDRMASAIQNKFNQ
jgi:Tfp pilus assembly protein FimV